MPDNTKDAAPAPKDGQQEVNTSLKTDPAAGIRAEGYTSVRPPESKSTADLPSLQIGGAEKPPPAAVDAKLVAGASVEIKDALGDLDSMGFVSGFRNSELRRSLTQMQDQISKGINTADDLNKLESSMTAFNKQVNDKVGHGVDSLSAHYLQLQPNKFMAAPDPDKLPSAADSSGAYAGFLQYQEAHPGKYGSAQDNLITNQAVMVSQALEDAAQKGPLTYGTTSDVIEQVRSEMNAASPGSAIETNEAELMAMKLARPDVADALNNYLEHAAPEHQLGPADVETGSINPYLRNQFRERFGFPSDQEMRAQADAKGAQPDATTKTPGLDSLAPADISKAVRDFSNVGSDAAGKDLFVAGLKDPAIMAQFLDGITDPTARDLAQDMVNKVKGMSDSDLARFQDGLLNQKVGPDLAQNGDPEFQLGLDSITKNAGVALAVLLAVSTAIAYAKSAKAADSEAKTGVPFFQGN